MQRCKKNSERNNYTVLKALKALFVLIVLEKDLCSTSVPSGASGPRGPPVPPPVGRARGRDRGHVMDPTSGSPTKGITNSHIVVCLQKY